MAISQEKSVDFVNTIALYPCIYNYTHSGYNRLDLKEKAWEDIAKKMGDSVSACKERWRNIRTVFLRHVKCRKVKEGSTSREFKRKYYLEEAMQFMLPYMKIRPEKSLLVSLESEDIHLSSDKISSDQISDFSETQNSMEPAQSDTSNLDITEIDDTEFIYKKEKESEDERFENYFEVKRPKFAPCEDADRNFLLSLLPDIQEMNSHQKRRFKMEIFNVIRNILGDPM